MTANADAQDLPFDPDALREKYRVEREKRLRPDGIAQYQQLTGELGAFLDDPNVDEIVPREPIEETLDVVVIGGGFSGLCTGARLRQAGIDDFRMIETGGGFGGTWYWNQYPGVQCDIESYIYLPLLEELGYMPRHQAIQLRAARSSGVLPTNIARHYDLYAGCALRHGPVVDPSRLGRRRGRAGRDPDPSQDDRFGMRASSSMANGAASHRPKLPGIPGIEVFEGHTFHTSPLGLRLHGRGCERAT